MKRLEQERVRGVGGETSAIPADAAVRPRVREKAEMKKTAAVVLVALGIVASVSANEPDLLARFEGGIGVIPAQNGAGPANPDGTLPNVRLNVVRGVSPAGGPWRIADLRATVHRDGRIKVRGRGLLLASGNSIGQNANQSVFATLICETAVPFVERNTTFAVPLAVNGDFRIEDTLSSVPQDCASGVLLIRSSGNGTWFAAGVPKLGDD